MKRFFTILIVLGAMLVSAPLPVRASLFTPTVVGVAWNEAGAMIYRSKTKENHFGLSYEVGMSTTNDGKIEVLLHPGLQVKVLRFDALIPWSRYLVYRFRVIDEEGNLVDANPRMSLNTPNEAWSPVGNCLVADTSKLAYESFTGSIVAYSDKRTDKRYLLFFRSVDHERVTNALSYSFSVFNGGDRVRRRLAVRGLSDSSSPEYQQAFYAALKKEMESSMPGAEWLASPLLTAEEEAAVWYQMAATRPKQPTSQAISDQALVSTPHQETVNVLVSAIFAYRISVTCTAPGWSINQLMLIVIDPAGSEIYRGAVNDDFVRNLARGTYRCKIARRSVVVLNRQFEVGPGKDGLNIVFRTEGGQR